uniref:Putative secreted protein n=1 Tax=Ixodes ricinus TaxID=34613 RepID=A0A0K8RDT7_IXORI
MRIACILMGLAVLVALAEYHAIQSNKPACRASTFRPKKLPRWTELRNCREAAGVVCEANGTFSDLLIRKRPAKPSPTPSSRKWEPFLSAY